MVSCGKIKEETLDDTTEKLSQPKGRPREFDVDQALERALEVFWRKGYEGASLTELTEAMGINRPSLYAAFGNKEALFRRALDRYITGPAAYTYEALEAPTARGVAERLLRGTADALTDPRNPAGCLAVQGSMTCGEAAESIKAEVCARRSEFEAQLRKRLERAKDHGDLPGDANCADLARLLLTVGQGMAVQAAGGAVRRDLRNVVELVLASWPGK